MDRSRDIPGPRIRTILAGAIRRLEGYRRKVAMERPEDIKKAHPKASILKGGRVVFNIKGNDYRLIALVQYAHGVLMIRFFGSHEDYDKVDAETV